MPIDVGILIATIVIESLLILVGVVQDLMKFVKDVDDHWEDRFGV